MAELDYRGDIDGSISTMGRMRGAPEYTGELAGLMGASILGPISPMLAPLLNPVIGNGIGGAVATMASMPSDAEAGIFATIGKGLSKASLRGRGDAWVNALGDEVFEIPTSGMINAVKGNGKMDNLKGYLDMEKMGTDKYTKFGSQLDDSAISQVNRAVDAANAAPPEGFSPFQFMKEGYNPLVTRGVNGVDGSAVNSWLSRAQKIETGTHETQHAVQRGDMLNSSAGEFWAGDLPYGYMDELAEIEARQAGRRARYPKELTSSRSEFGIHPEVRFYGDKFAPDSDVVLRHRNNGYLNEGEVGSRWGLLQKESDRLNELYKNNPKFKKSVNDAHKVPLVDKVDYNLGAAVAATVPAAYAGAGLINAGMDEYYDGKRRDEGIRSMIQEKMSTPPLSQQLVDWDENLGVGNER